jgi:hypothetical protein
MGGGMSAATFDWEADIVEARRYIDRALGGIATLHIGPLDFNVSTTVDDLLAAIRLLERFRNEARGKRV